MRRLRRELRGRDQGATFPEYALMTTLIAIAAFTGAAALGLEVRALLELPFP